LPEQKIRQADLARGADQKVERGQFRRVQMLLDRLFVDRARIQRTRRHLLGKLAGRAASSARAP
jgi:hypothetical protein